MGLFDFLKKNKDKKENQDKEKIAECIFCNEPIYETDVYKVIHWRGNKFYMHKKCFKKAKKLALQLVKNGLQA